MTSVVYDFDDIRSRRPGAEPTWSMEQGARPLEGARDTIGPAVEADLCATGGRLRRGDPCQANMSAKRELRALFGAAAPDSSDGTGTGCPSTKHLSGGPPSGERMMASN